MATLRRVIVSTGNTASALGFYRDLLGLAPDYEAGPITALRLADGTEFLLHQRATQPSDGAVAVSLVVADLDGVVRSWEAGGGEVVDPPEVQPWGERQAVVRDPDGHLVCLVASEPRS